MTLRNILVPVFPKISADAQLAAALDIARRLEAHINAIFVRPDPTATLATIPDAALTVALNWETFEKDGKAAATAARTKFEKWRKEHELASGMVDLSLRTPFACWSERVGAIEPTITQCARLSDLIILNHPDPDLAVTQAAFDAAVFESGRPALLVPKKVPDDLFRHITIAWNGSLEATRAIAGAMTMLHAAEEVSIFMTPQDAEKPPEDLDLAAFLKWHGINARYFQSRPDERPVGAALLRVAHERGATMVVMGAYTHSRLRQTFLGGVTQYVLDKGTIPVLMMH
jgi:nucleotide-binding universal stress UspA family protein